MRGVLRRIAIAAAGILAAAAVSPDVLSQLGITIDAAKAAVGTIVTGGIFNPGLPSRAFKALPPTARADVTTAGVAWLKAYVASPEFARQYADLRQRHQPQAPAWELTPEQELQKADADQKQQLEDSKRAIAALPAEQRAALEQSLKTAAASEAADTAKSRRTRLDAIKADRAAETQAYQQALSRFRQEYPEDPRPVVARRLREFLRLSADVDFDARLTSKGDTSVFENPAYQAKPSQWKLCYRAGREATTAARAAVQAWLVELGG